MMIRPQILLAIAAAIFLAGCADDARNRVLISTSDQAMLLYRDGRPVAYYPVSTSKFGTGDGVGTYRTPLGHLRVKTKIGGGEPPGAVFKSRRPTGEVIAVDAPGRDPIVTRILWLEGLEWRNRRAFARCIYIHGTPEERNIGTPASFGCIRMRSGDVIHLYDAIGLGARVDITTSPLPETPLRPIVPPVQGEPENPETVGTTVLQASGPQPVAEPSIPGIAPATLR